MIIILIIIIIIIIVIIIIIGIIMIITITIIFIKILISNNKILWNYDRWCILLVISLGVIGCGGNSLYEI